MELTIEMIKQLRQETGAGVLDCRKALEQAEANYGRALGLLREKGLQAAARRADRPVTQGVVELYAHGGGRVGVMVEINTETDFAARSAAFRGFAHEIALQIAAASPRYVRDEEIPAEALEEETQKAITRAREENKPEKIIPRIVDGYLKKFKDNNVLLRQAYIRDDQITVEQLLGQAMAAVGENIKIQRFARWELGETAENES